jgi:hypothetical protein
MPHLYSILSSWRRCLSRRRSSKLWLCLQKLNKTKKTKSMLSVDHRQKTFATPDGAGVAAWHQRKRNNAAPRARIAAI